MSAYLSLEDGKDMVEVHFDYDAAFVKEFKAELPYPARVWNNNRKCWMVHIDLVKDVADMLQKRFGRVSMNKNVEKMLKPKTDDGPMDPDTCGWLF